MKVKVVQGLLLLSMLAVTGCIGYTMWSHPEVEVYDEALQAYMLERVTVTANCRSCHSNQHDQFGTYAQLFFQQDSLSLSKKDTLRTCLSPSELRGYENYQHSDWGKYYYAVWWFNPIVVEQASNGTMEIINLTPSLTERLRQSPLVSRRRWDAVPNSTDTSASTRTSTAAPPTKADPPTQGERRTTSGEGANTRANQNESSADPATRESGRTRK
ncbi:MAG: hypothetical protein RMI34_10975 [Chloroherpetonaceae bacterium]|nr:hypothetical protein [Chloroherpetonaceae bacterium]MCS7210095.1 hypothetical protein [Chloroherpetonaceae bacterium]MDW8020583.1 hypothetical protein [Chloroherpetonaceae bacterium]